MRRSNFFVAVIVLAATALLILFGIIALTPPPSANTAQDDLAGLTPLEKPEVDFANPSLGPANAKVTVVEYGDYFCEPCVAMAQDLNRLVSEYPTSVRVIWKDFPNKTLHPEAPASAEAARCAGIQGAFWEYHDLLFANRGTSGTDAYVRLGATLGLDDTAYRGCVENGSASALVARDFEEGLRLRIDATPYLFINGRRVSGSTGYDQLKTLVEAALAE